SLLCRGEVPRHRTNPRFLVADPCLVVRGRTPPRRRLARREELAESSRPARVELVLGDLNHGVGDPARRRTRSRFVVRGSGEQILRLAELAQSLLAALGAEQEASESESHPCLREPVTRLSISRCRPVAMSGITQF